MEIENSLFRIHERILSNDLSKIISKYLCIYLCSILGLFSFIIFIYANVVYKNTSYCLMNTYDQILDNKYKYANGSDVNVSLVKDWEINIVDFKDIDTEFLFNYDRNEKISNLSEFIDKTYSQIEFTSILPLIVMDEKMKKEHNFTKFQLFLDSKCYASNTFSKLIIFSLIGLDSIVINEILYLFNEEKYFYLHNLQNNEKFAFSQQDLSIYYWKDDYIICFFTRLFSIPRILLGLFLVSNITSIYIKMTIICAPIFVLLMMECCLGENSNEANYSGLAIFRAFPWVGIYLYALLLNRKPKKFLIAAFLLMLCLFYFIYLGSYYIWTFLLFNHPIQAGLDENFYVLCAFLEFICLLFIRTRSSLKFLPRLLILLLFIYSYYINNTAFGFYSLAYYLTLNFALVFIGLSLICFEIPALSWNPSFHYTPCIEKPRTLYFPLFSLSSYHDLPQLWSMFYPLHDRSMFTESQMALIDRNYLSLNTILQNSLSNTNGLHINNDGDIELQEVVNNNIIYHDNSNNIELQPQNNHNNINDIIAINNNINSNQRNDNDIEENLLNMEIIPPPTTNQQNNDNDQIKNNDLKSLTDYRRF